MTVHVTLAQAEGQLAEILEIAATGEVVAIEREGFPPIYVGLRVPGRRPSGVWSQYGPLSDPDLLLRPDPELEALADKSIFPPE